jgi:hypothetical protein
VLTQGLYTLTVPMRFFRLILFRHASILHDSGYETQNDLIILF